MAVACKEKNIGGSMWRANTLPATVGLEILTKLGGIASGPISVLNGGEGSAGDALAALAGKLAESGTPGLIQKLVSGVTKNGRDIDFETEFSADYGILTQLVMWLLEVNFSSFLAGNPVLAGLLAKAEVPASTPAPIT